MPIQSGQIRFSVGMVTWLSFNAPLYWQATICSLQELSIIVSQSYSGFVKSRQEERKPHFADGDTFAVSGIHSAIRHPWCLAGILIVWAQDLSFFVILNDIVISIYFIIGSFLEERKMMRKFGQRYRDYQRTVSMLVPYHCLKTR